MSQFAWPAVLVAVAVLLWPERRRVRGALVTAPASTIHPRVRSRRRHTVEVTGDEPVMPAASVTAWLGGWRDRLPGRRSDDVDRRLLTTTEALAGALRAGLPPADALALAASDIEGALGEALRGVERRARMGEGLATGWAEAAERLDNDELRVLARAWSLSEETGTALADAASTTAQVLRNRREQRDRTKTAVAGARTTMTILTILPIGGPLLGAVMGLDLRRLYAESPTVWAALGAGAALILIGRWWVDRLIIHTLAGPELR